MQPLRRQTGTPDYRAELFELIRTRSFGRGKIMLASGRESDFYFDMKPAMLDPDGANLLAELILHELQDVKADCIGGLEMGAVPLIAPVAMRSSGVGRLLGQRVEFRGRDVLETTAIELRRPLERDAALVAVRVYAGEIRITPRRPTGLPILDIRRQRHRGLALLETFGDAQNEFAFRLFGRLHIARRLRLTGERNGGERRGKTDDDGCA
jgi:hypothetical protein